MYHYNAHIIEVVDNETVTAEVDLGFHKIQKMTLRLYGMTEPSQGISTETAQAMLEELVLHKQVEIFTHAPEAIDGGRYQATIVLDGLDINHWLSQSTLALEHAL